MVAQAPPPHRLTRLSEAGNGRGRAAETAGTGRWLWPPSPQPESHNCAVRLDSMRWVVRTDTRPGRSGVVFAPTAALLYSNGHSRLMRRRTLARFLRNRTERGSRGADPAQAGEWAVVRQPPAHHAPDIGRRTSLSPPDSPEPPLVTLCATSARTVKEQNPTRTPDTVHTVRASEWWWGRAVARVAHTPEAARAATVVARRPRVDAPAGGRRRSGIAKGGAGDNDAGRRRGSSRPPGLRQAGGDGSSL